MATANLRPPSMGVERVDGARGSSLHNHGVTQTRINPQPPSSTSNQKNSVNASHPIHPLPKSSQRPILNIAEKQPQFEAMPQNADQESFSSSVPLMTAEAPNLYIDSPRRPPEMVEISLEDTSDLRIQRQRIGIATVILLSLAVVACVVLMHFIANIQKEPSAK